MIRKCWIQTRVWILDEFHQVIGQTSANGLTELSLESAGVELLLRWKGGKATTSNKVGWFSRKAKELTSIGLTCCGTANQRQQGVRGNRNLQMRDKKNDKILLVLNKSTGC